ncbi:MAG: hypothetical protein SPI30_02015 [Prevotella sp.]|nr:hypothetical protein [Prevotella sp.]
MAVRLLAFCPLCCLVSATARTTCERAKKDYRPHATFPLPFHRPLKPIAMTNRQADKGKNLRHEGTSMRQTGHIFRSRLFCLLQGKKEKTGQKKEIFRSGKTGWPSRGKERQKRQKATSTTRNAV